MPEVEGRNDTVKLERAGARDDAVAESVGSYSY